LKRSQANLLLLAVAVIWGSAFVAQAEGMAGVGPLTFTGIRFLLGTAVVARSPGASGASCCRTRRRSDRYPTDALGISALGVLLMLGAVFQQIGIISTTVTNAGFLTALYVPLVPLLGWLILRTPRTGRCGRRRSVAWPAPGCSPARRASSPSSATCG
jgi:drug/metabolite transporter (DMT)-like permease